MALRPAATMRTPKKTAWTRYSKKKPRLSYIKAMPHRDLNIFSMGQKNGGYDFRVDIVSKEDVQLRDNALESARQTANKYLEKTIANKYYFTVNVYPHIVIRENRMIAGVRADRLQKGMRLSFGRPNDRAARVATDTSIFTLYAFSSDKEILREAAKRAIRKLSGSYKIVEENTHG